MYFKCQQCNKDRIFLFPWLAGQDICNECKDQFVDRMRGGLCVECGTSQNVCFSGRCEKCNKLFTEDELSWQKDLATKAQERKLVDEKSQQTADKILKHGKETVSIIFGAVALLWFIVMLPAQPDFQGIVIGWLIIGGIYLIVKVIYKI